MSDNGKMVEVPDMSSETFPWVFALMSHHVGFRVKETEKGARIFLIPIGTDQSSWEKFNLRGTKFDNGYKAWIYEDEIPYFENTFHRPILATAAVSRWNITGWRDLPEELKRVKKSSKFGILSTYINFPYQGNPGGAINLQRKGIGTASLRILENLAYKNAFSFVIEHVNKTNINSNGLAESRGYIKHEYKNGRNDYLYYKRIK